MKSAKQITKETAGQLERMALAKGVNPEIAKGWSRLWITGTEEQKEEIMRTVQLLAKAK